MYVAVLKNGLIVGGPRPDTGHYVRESALDNPFSTRAEVNKFLGINGQPQPWYVIMTVEEARIWMTLNEM